MPYFKKNEGFSLGFTPYTRGDGSPFKSTPASRLRDAKRNAKFDYRNAIAGTKDPTLIRQAKADYKRKMQKIREKQKALRSSPFKRKTYMGKRIKRTLNPFDSHHGVDNMYGYKQKIKIRRKKHKPKQGGEGGSAEISR